MSDTPSLDRLLNPEPPTATDSDMIVMAINRLNRAVVKMQAHEYDEELNEHLEKAAAFMGWVATNMWVRNEREKDGQAGEVPGGTP